MRILRSSPRFSIWLCVAAALCAAGCGPTREIEPNNTALTATPLKPGHTAVGTISNPSDIDWYRLDVPGDGILSAKVGGIRDIDFVLSAYDKDAREIKRIDETSVGGDEVLLDLGVSAGIYYLSVSNKNPRGNNPTQEYRLETKLESDKGREREPNDSAATAQPISAGGSVRGHFWPTRNLLSEDPDAGEEDWYSVAIDKPGLYVLSAEVSGVPRVDSVMEVYDENGYLLKAVDGGGVGEGEVLRNLGVRGPGKLSLRLRSKNRNGGNPDYPYDLLTEVLPYAGMTELEPNDQRTDATAFEHDEITGTIFPAGDQDWYKVVVDTDGKFILRAEVTALPGIDLTLSLKDSRGDNLLTVDNMGRENPEVLTGWGVARGEYYLVVAEKTGRKADARATYTLSKSLVPWQNGLEWEPNDDAKSAQAVKVGDSVDGYFAPKGDQDWYEFNLYQDGNVDLSLTGVINVTATMTLYDQENKEIARAAAAKSGDSVALSRPLVRGTYSVRLMPADPAEVNVRDKYTFGVRVK